MTIGVGDWLKSHDSLGSPIMLHYKGRNGFGTELGGFCSLLLRTFIFLFITWQLYHGFYKPNYEQELINGVEDHAINDPFNIKTNQFLPMFAIIDMKGLGLDDLTKWDVAWTQKSYGTESTYETVTCIDLINEMDGITEEEREEMLAYVTISTKARFT